MEKNVGINVKLYKVYLWCVFLYGIVIKQSGTQLPAPEHKHKTEIGKEKCLY